MKDNEINNGLKLIGKFTAIVLVGTGIILSIALVVLVPVGFFM